MARAELRGKKRIHRERKKTCRGRDAILLHNDGAVVKRGTWAEDRGQQTVGKPGVEWISAFDVRAQADFALNDDQSTGLVLRKEIRCKHDVVVGIAFNGRRSQKCEAASQIGENVANLRLKNNDERKHYVRQDVRDHPI